MSFTLYDIYFSGQVIEGNDPAEVKQKIARLFKADAAKVERMFSGTPVRIKSAVDQETASKYRGAFRDAGALLEVRPVEDEPAPQTEAEEAAAQTGGESMDLLPPRTGSLEECQTPVEPAPLPDISGIDLSPVGAMVDEHEPPADAEIDTSGLSLDPEGVTIDESEPAPQADINTEDLDLGEPNSGSLEDCHVPKEPAKIPDISELKLADDEEEPKPEE
ncbi:MAG: hypothetical protein ABW120_11325 [Sedimenticola sp.]